MLRSLKTYHNGPITRKETTLYNLMDEINQSFSINSIYVDKKENRGFVRSLKPLMHNKFNGKGKLSSLIEQVKDYENKTILIYEWKKEGSKVIDLVARK